MGTYIDTSELRALANDLARAPERTKAKARKVMVVGANKVKKGMRRDASGHRYLPELGSHVSYDMLTVGLGFEVGIDKVGQGRLGNIAAYGTSNNAPVFDHTAAARREVPLIVNHLGDALEESALGGRR